MKLKKFKERDNKRIGIIVFTIVCILLVSGVILYRTFAIFEVKTNQNVINGEVQSMGDLEFAFYKEVDGKDTIVKEVPRKDEGYSLDTSSSYCKDLLNDKQVSTVNWDYENWEVRLKNVTTTKTKCYLHFKKVYKDTVLNGADPDLMNGRLVPVKILDNEKPSDVTEYTNVSKTYGGKVIKADITENWYSYANNQWANAVILKDGKADDYTPGQEILESDIESYFVWIPRYRYKIWFDETESLKFIPLENVNSYTQIPNYGQANAVEIIFENKESENMTNNVKDKYLTHPAFVAFDTNGFWVGKFETGFKGANSKDEAQNKNVTDTTDISKIVIKPNVYSWRNIDASNAFYTSYYYQRELESHMAKNSEWGAVVYLANSKYGRCTETDCNEVTLNNNTSFVTGYSANKVELSIYKENGIKEEVPINQDGQYGCSYYSQNSVQASTTGNYSGIYDMSGGSWEHVMGVMQASKTSAIPSSGADNIYNSGFKGPYSNCKENGIQNGADCENNLYNIDGYDWPSSKYYDLYDYGESENEIFRGYLGDATKELGPFYTFDIFRVSSLYADNIIYVTSRNPWFIRGGRSVDASIRTGISTLGSYYGEGDFDISFRIILTP